MMAMIVMTMAMATKYDVRCKLTAAGHNADDVLCVMYAVRRVLADG